jgi:hypothetical protein
VLTVVVSNNEGSRGSTWLPFLLSLGVQGVGVEHFGHFTAVESENGPSQGGGVEQGRGFLSRKPRNHPHLLLYFSPFLLFWV